MFSDEVSSSDLTYLQWSMVRSLKEGEQECGDTYIVKEFCDEVLLAVVDGLGHGSMAAKASRKAITLLQSYSGQSLISLLKYCHEGLRDTRGVVMSVALLNRVEDILTWIGVGNVEVALLFSDSFGTQIKRMIPIGGIVGYNLPLLQASIVPVSHNDTLIFTTDGVRNDFLERVDRNESPKKNVDSIASNCLKRSDDSLVLVAKYEKGAAA